MKVLFIPAKIKKRIFLPKSLINTLKPYKKVGLAATIQFSSQLQNISEILKNSGHEVILFRSGKSNEQGIKSKEPGQILGCDANPKEDADAWLFIGDGKFHPLELAMNIKAPVFCFNPFTKKFSKISQKERNQFFNRRVIKLKYLEEAKRVGILISTKPGQYKPKLAQKIKRLLEKFGKEAYLFICDTIRAEEFLNFPEIEVWVNTACPRIADDYLPKPIINADWIIANIKNLNVKEKS